MHMKLREAIQNVGQRLKVVIVLRIDEDRSYDEIAKVLKIPTGTVMSRLNRARERLKKSIGSYIIDEK